MIIQKKPDYLIFADSAKKGEVTDFPDVSRGWGITIDQTASKPPMEWMNGAFNRIDKNMLYLLQQGVPEWCESVTYPANAIIKYNGILYTAIVSNDNARPSTNTTKWKKTQDEIPNASITQNGLVTLSSSINSESETEAATPLAIKNVNDNAVPKSRKINGKKLDADVILTATDVGALTKLDYSYDINDSMTVLRRADGLIVQKFVANYNESHGETGTVIALPVTFPNVFYFALASDAYRGCHTTSAILNSRSSVRIWGKTGNNYTQSSVQIIAIGR